MTKPATAAFLAAALVLAGCGHVAPGAATAVRTKTVQAKDASTFFANPALEAKSPGAFAVQAEAHGFLQAAADVTQPERDAVVAAVRGDQALASQVARFDKLSWDEQVPVLQRVAALEGQAMHFTLPPVVIQAGPNPIPSFFDFDPSKGGTGRVILYPDAIAKESNKWTALMLTVHEVRHSGQFQLAFGQGQRDAAHQALATGFKASFIAQKALYHQLGFCDFCSLLNEYEAFQTGNYVVGALSGWTIDQSDEGCLSSQYDRAGKPKLDLLALSNKVGPQGLLAAFNELEKVQFGS